MWINSKIIESISFFPLNYVKEFKAGKGLLVQRIVYQQKVLLVFLQPCTSLKSERANMCLSRKKDIPCCNLCKLRDGWKYTRNITQSQLTDVKVKI